ncbi:MAG: alkaline phosphatase family protein [Actinomycetota bacterium]
MRLAKGRLTGDKRGLTVALVALVAVLLVTFGVAAALREPRRPVPSFAEQACSLPDELLERTERGYFEPRSGQISLLPKTPAYMASGAGGWSHSGPWPYLQDVPLVFYGPGVIDSGVTVDRPVTSADIAPTLAGLMKGRLGAADGEALEEVVGSSGETATRKVPKLILTIVWDGGGWNTLDLWNDSWPNLRAMMDGGVNFTHATVGSSPSVTPAVHTTIGTGVFPDTHGITGVPVRDENGEVVDAFLKGESSRFIQVPALAERWDELNGNEAKIGMVGYEPWHLGMIGQGAERVGGDRDDAAWLDTETNDWITNEDHYRLPPSLLAAEGLDALVEELDAADGLVDDSWREDVSLDDPGRAEETPAFIGYHTNAMLEMIAAEGYGRDGITDLLFTNYKQIDRIGHYYNMNSDYVNDALVRTDEELGKIFTELDRVVGRGEWVVALTADHGQQPDAADVDGYGVNPREIEDDIRDQFGDVVRAVWPTEVFLLDDALEREDVTVERVANFLGGYTVGDNNDSDVGDLVGGTGRFEADERLFAMAIPAALLDEGACDDEASRP